jgi:hypothetical protein
MLTVKYTGEGERTVGVRVVYPGELLSATPAMLAAWRAVHGDVFAVVGEAYVPVSEGAGAVVVDAGGGTHVFGDVAEADAEAAKSKRGRGK